MTAALVLVALFVGFAGGWFVKQRLSLHYKQLWMKATKLLEDKQLFDDSDQDLAAALPATVPSPMAAATYKSRPAPHKGHEPNYIHGKWALDETRDGTTAIFQAVRLGFDPIELGRTPNADRFKALYRRDQENAQSAVADLNNKK